MIFSTRSRWAAMKAALSLLVVAGAAATANAQTYVINVSNIGDAVAIEQAKPEYPEGLVRRGQDGWVRMHFVIDADGRAVDPIIVDSSGGQAFEAKAIEVAQTWRFEVPESDAETPNNLVNIRTQVRRGAGTASRDFKRAYNGIVEQFGAEQIDSARTEADAVQEKGGWNLYESTLLWLLIGRIESVEGHMAQKLEAYRRALSISTRRTLGNRDRVMLTGAIFRLQDEMGLYAEAMRTFARLERLDESNDLAAELAPRAAEIDALLQSDNALTARATIYNPCDCDAGKPLWYYKPARRTFSFANPNGNVERFEARCETHRVRDDVELGKSWTLAPEWGDCRLFVFGDDGASFDFVEHPVDGGQHNTGDASVARNHVLDRRN